MADIDGQDGEAKLQRRDAYKQVGEGDGYALRLLFAVDLCGQQGGRFGVWIDGEIAEKFVDKSLAAKPHLQSLRTINTVRKFRQPDRREGCFLIASYRDDLLDQLFDSIPSALGTDQNA